MTASTTPEASGGPACVYAFILFVAGEETNSRMARKNLAQICEDGLQGRCKVRIVDVLKDFETAAKYNILLTPTLLRVRPEPVVTILGNLNHHEKVRPALGV
jgi:circadian clock protein KaiB